MCQCEAQNDEAGKQEGELVPGVVKHEETGIERQHREEKGRLKYGLEVVVGFLQQRPDLDGICGDELIQLLEDIGPELTDSP